MNNHQEDPYETLNIPRTATQSQIKSAYRKLALKYHPDKQTTTNEEEKKKYNELFTKIGNAYEILGDVERRAEYDRFGTVGNGGRAGQYQQQQQYYDPFSAGGGFGSGGGAFFGGFGNTHPFNDPFFGGRGVGGGGMNGGFMDPFELFRNVFSEDFDDFHDMHGHRQHHQQQHNAMHRNSDPFSFMGRHMDMMNSMMNMNSGGSSSNHYSSYSSSSSSFGGTNAGGRRESVTTSTRIINGKRQTITERTVVNPDGTVETTRETSGDDDFPSALEYGNQNNNNIMNGNSNQNYLPDSSTGGRGRGFFGGRR